MKWTIAKPDFACLRLKKYDHTGHQMVIVFRNPYVMLRVRLTLYWRNSKIFPQSFARTSMIEIRRWLPNS